MPRRKDRSERDRAGVGPEPHPSRRLVRLDELDDYDFAEGEPDIRGWDVLTVNGRELGEVEEVLVDPDRGEVVMLDVELRDGAVHAEVPIRAVQLDRDRRVVLLDSGDLSGDFDRGVRREGNARDYRDVVSDNPRVAGSDTSYGTRSEYSDGSAQLERDQASADDDEVVVERRRVVEEVGVRRRPIGEA
jgi:hypothetical protein